ncbi:MAG TPA: hypothetical protein P5526_20895 [Anaerolineae bacterium]|nr:hypothetical protein [Anaerolineae bacterium]MCB0224574.1 hypothetical protein [Anaerolineae bacterium]MCB9108548.1 hypothetical protein [Anaerolineales bacterium]HRV94629.1 hypothetical protein [Anaerolineae bacterium]
MSTLEEAIQHIRMGNREEGRQILEDLLETQEENEDVWLWLTSVVDSDEDREICLENVLALNPNNVVAQRGMEALHAGTFDASDMLSDVLEEWDEEPATFIDDFVVTDDDDIEEELTLPSSMKQGAKKSKAKKAGSGINMRLVIILLVVLLVVLGLGGIAVASVIFGFGSGDSGEANPAGNPPAGSVEAVSPPTEEPTPTETATPEATATATNTPLPHLELPTAKPTDPPTPIPTQVVSPTPNR